MCSAMTYSRLLSVYIRNPDFQILTVMLLGSYVKSIGYDSIDDFSKEDAGISYRGT